VRYLLFLQHAWSSLYAGRHWPRRSWLRALKRSRSGRRLGRLIADLDDGLADPYEICHNTTSLVGETPASKLPADPIHIRSLLARYKPGAVIACGRQAEAALCELWDGPLLVVPHPAARRLTDALFLPRPKQETETMNLANKHDRPDQVRNQLLDAGVASSEGEAYHLERVWRAAGCPPGLQIDTDSTNVWTYVSQWGGPPIDVDPQDSQPHHTAAMRWVASEMCRRDLDVAMINGELVDVREWATRDSYCRRHLGSYAVG